MPSDGIEHASAFDCKATELARKGHLLRAVENYGRAAEAARDALGADNLVTIYMLLQQAQLSGLYALAPDAPADTPTRAAHRAAYVSLLSGALEALDRRRVAGTLLDGKCAAAEEAWHAALLQRDNSHLTAAMAASWASLVGTEVYIRAGTYAAGLLASISGFACKTDALRSWASTAYAATSGARRNHVACAPQAMRLRGRFRRAGRS